MHEIVESSQKNDAEDWQEPRRTARRRVQNLQNKFSPEYTKYIESFKTKPKK